MKLRMNSLRSDKLSIPVAPFSMSSRSPVPLVPHRSIQTEKLRPVRSSANQPFSTRSPQSSPRLLGSSDEVRRLRTEVDKLEKQLCESRQRYEEESRARIKEKAELESECRRLKRMLDNKYQTRDIGTQTATAPVPIPVSLMRRTRPSPTPPIPIPQQVYEQEDPKENVVHTVVPPTPVAFKESSPRKLITSSLKGSPKASLRRALASQTNSPRPVVLPPKANRRVSVGPTPTASAAQTLIDKLNEDETLFVRAINDHFVRLDGGNDGFIPRDACLVLVSLVLEEQGLRHCAVPKVICSRLLKSVTANVSRMSDVPPSPSGKPTGPVLRREHATEFIKLALEFILDQERPQSAQLV